MSYLVARAFNGTIAVGRLVNGTTFTQVGPNLPSQVAENTGGALSNYFTVNRAIVYKNEVYVIHNGVIYKYDEVGNSWVTEVTLPITSGERHVGLHIYSDGAGNDVLATVFHYTGTTTIGIARKTSPTATWSTVDTGALAQATFGTSKPILFRNNLFWGDSNIGGIVQLELATGAVTTYTALGGNTRSAAFCIRNNELYCVLVNSITSLSLKAYKFSGGAWSLITSIVGTTTSGANLTPAFFLDETTDDLIIIAEMFNNGAGAWSINTADVLGVLTSAVIPAGLTGVNQEGDWVVSVDNSNFPSPSTIHLWRLNNNTGNTNPAAGTWSHWLWNGEASLITDGSPAGAAGLTLTNLSSGGGERIWTSGQLNIEIIGMQAALGGEEITFVAYGDPLKISYSGKTGTFAPGDTITGGTSGATGTVILDDATGSQFHVGGVSGTFQSGETLTSTSGGSATYVSSTGALATRTVTFGFSSQEETALSSATLVPSTVSASPAVISLANTASSVTNVIADGITQYKVLRDSQTDGLIIGSNEHIVPSITV